MVEQGYVCSRGRWFVASDSHSNLYGAAAALGTPVVRTDAASIWATGSDLVAGFPKVAKMLLKGNLSPGRPPAKDVHHPRYGGLFNKGRGP